MKSHFFQQNCDLLGSAVCSFPRVLFLFGEQHAPNYLGQTQRRSGSKKKQRKREKEGFCGDDMVSKRFS